MLSYPSCPDSWGKSRNAAKMLVVLFGVIIIFAFSKNIPAQQWSAEQQEVWKAINSQWQADKE